MANLTPVVVPMTMSTSDTQLNMELASDLEQMDFNLQQLVMASKDYNDLAHKPSINGVTLQGDKTSSQLYIVKSGSTAYWAQQITYIPKAGEVIVYTDYTSADGTAAPGIKIGDGLAFVVDLPFVAGRGYEDIMAHMNDHTVHITNAERLNWNGKVSCRAEAVGDGSYELIFETT